MKLKSLFVTGTDTGVGKTIITYLLARSLKEQGLSVAVMKPLATGAKVLKGKGQEEFLAEDLALLRKGLKDFPSQAIYNPVCFENPLSPVVAAEIENKKINFNLIYNSYKRFKQHYDFVLIEGIGGIMVPVTNNFFVGDLIKKMKSPVMIVARPNLGTLNHTFLTINYAKKLKLPIKGVILNHTQKSSGSLAEKTNPDCITKVSGVPVLLTVPFFSGLNRAVSSAKLDSIYQLMRKKLGQIFK